MNFKDPFLISLGWNDHLQEQFSAGAKPGDGQFPARIIGQGRGHYRIQVTDDIVLDAEITTKLHHVCKTNDDFPAVGDWVAFTRGHGSKKSSIERVLPRKSMLQRNRAGNKKAQQLVANVDALLIVTSVKDDFDVERLGRYLDIGTTSSVASAFVLTKVDLVANAQDFAQKLKQSYPGVEVFLISSKDPQTMEPLQKYFAPGMTAVLLGSSGVGKSTLTNYLQGSDTQKTGTLSGDTRGKHTTTSRNLLFTRWSGMVIDTPGMQEIGAIETEELGTTDFPAVQALTMQCKFTNCRHANDPGCAITAALKDGSLSAESWAAYSKAASRVAVPKKKWEK